MWNEFAAKQHHAAPLRQHAQPFLLGVVGPVQAVVVAVVRLPIGREIEGEGDAAVRLVAMLVEVPGVALAGIISCEMEFAALQPQVELQIQFLPECFGPIQEAPFCAASSFGFQPEYGVAAYSGNAL